ncbi:carboxypeptidase family protein [Edaphobacter aggregans]|uniref:Carboxypeptidase family protein n=1 Tax=Edaphobacter aggregans TaxID=570835 RepID=A0A428MKA4_9BACT|nr:carboxypeptidase regulatory-like domain-containing protein [Edaphobacter aggregans]RSL17290.1 carboxypeptidase family protein [Edaphobacter aggregans]
MFKPRHFFSALLLLPFVTAFAQTPDTATITGTVTDPMHAVVAGAQIHVINTLTGLDRTATSNQEGKFTIPGLPVAGAYGVSAASTGFVATHLEHVTLAGGSTATVSLELNVAGAATEVTVMGAADGLRTDQPQLGERLDSPQIEETPLANHRITFLPLLNAANRPAINQGDIFMNQNLFTTNGAGRRQTWFEVDGSTGNDSWGRQTIFTNLPIAAVQEMTVLTNGFSAEYGAGTGSVVNIVTKSGGKNLHGELGGLWRPSGPEAALSGFTTSNAASGNDITNDTLWQGSGALSGPIGHSGVTQFFVAGEHSDQDRASPVTSPLAPGNYIGHYRDWLGFLRLDHQFNSRNNAFFRGNVDSFYDTNPNGTVGGSTLPSVARVFRRRTYSAELGETSVLRPNLLNSARLQFQLASPVTEFDPVINGTQFVVPISSGGTFTSGTSQSALLMNRQYQINNTLSANLGRHQINVGGNAIIAHNGGNSKEFGGPIYLGKFTYNTCTQSAAICESPAFLNNIANVANYQQSYGNAAYTVDDTLWSLFVQDDFHMSRTLTLNMGLRYEQQTFTDGKLNFAPRAGFVYDVTGRSEIVVRGSFGIYHSQVVDDSQANYSLTGPTGVFNYTATPGQVGFPTSIAAAPLPSFPTGAQVPLRSLYIRPGRSAYYDQFFPTSTLVGYPDKLLNPYSEQWTLGLEHQFSPAWVLSVDYVGTHTLRINRPLDVDGPAPFVRTVQGQTRSAQAANCTRPYWVYWYGQSGKPCNAAVASNPQPAYSVIQSDVNDGYLHYNALDLNVRHNFSHGFSVLASYTWSHTQDNVDPDTTSQNPNDTNFTGRQEYGNAIYDQRHRLVLSGIYVAPFAIHIGGVATMAGGLPYNIVTGTTNSGNTGATTDRPVINGAVVGRNTGRGNAIYDVSPFISRAFPIIRERVNLDLRAEAFNVLNHANFVGYSGTYGNGSSAGVGFGTPLAGITNQLPARSLQFSGKLSF